MCRYCVLAQSVIVVGCPQGLIGVQKAIVKLPLQSVDILQHPDEQIYTSRYACQIVWSNQRIPSHIKTAPHMQVSSGICSCSSFCGVAEALHNILQPLIKFWTIISARLPEMEWVQPSTASTAKQFSAASAVPSEAASRVSVFFRKRAASTARLMSCHCGNPAMLFSSVLGRHWPSALVRHRIDKGRAKLHKNSIQHPSRLAGRSATFIDVL